MELPKGKLFPKAKRARQLGIAVVVLAAAGLIAYSSWGFWQRYRATHNPGPTISKAIITHSTDTPDETPPTNACASYTVAGQIPERISLPSIGTSGCIEQAGIDQHGAIAVPTSIYTAAWYVKSALPGQPGLSIIDGHVSGRYDTNSIFHDLDRLETGDTFTVTLGSGKVLDYQVYKTQSVPLDQSVDVLLTKDPAASQLNLITCGGRYDKNTKLYDHRTIVSAKLVSK